MRRYAMILCSSFLLGTVPYALYNYLFAVSDTISSEKILQIFVITLSIATLMMIYEKIAAKRLFSSVLFDFFMRVAIVLVVVFVEGPLMGMFQVRLSTFLRLLPVIALVFVGSYLITYFSVIEYASAINDSIRRRRSKRRKE